LAGWILAGVAIDPRAPRRVVGVRDHHDGVRLQRDVEHHAVRGTGVDHSDAVGIVGSAAERRWRFAVRIGLEQHGGVELQVASVAAPRTDPLRPRSSGGLVREPDHSVRDAHPRQGGAILVDADVTIAHGEWDAWVALEQRRRLVVLGARDGDPLHGREVEQRRARRSNTVDDVGREVLGRTLARDPRVDGTQVLGVSR
jgi:hypothetical protein